MSHEIDEKTLNEYLDKFPAPLEQFFFGDKQKQKLSLERAKLEGTIQYAESIERNPELGSNLDKDVVAGKVYSVGQANDVIARIEALEDANGARNDLRKSFVNPTGQLVILSERVCQKLGVIADGFLMGEDIDDLINALNDEFVDATAVAKVREAQQVYPAIIIQRGTYVALQPLLEETAPISMPKAPGTVAAPSMKMNADHGASLEALRRNIIATPAPVLSTVPKPIMPVPKPVAPTPPKNSEMNPAELKREMTAKELPGHQNAPAPKPVAPLTPPPMPKPVMPPVIKPVMPTMTTPKPVAPMPAMPHAPRPVPAPTLNLNKNVTTGLANLNEITVIDDLKRIEPAHLRLGGLSDQFKQIKSKIGFLANANHLLPIQVVDVFQQSPLFRLYLSMGNALIAATMGESKPDYRQVAAAMAAENKEVLSLQEFEGMADLRKELEHM